jgi:hypothetical protein
MTLQFSSDWQTRDADLSTQFVVDLGHGASLNSGCVKNWFVNRAADYAAMSEW